MAYGGMSGNRRGAPAPRVATVVTRVRRDGQQVAVRGGRASRSPYGADYAAALHEAATFAPNPLAGANPSRFTGGVLGVARRDPSLFNRGRIAQVEAVPVVDDAAPFNQYPPQYALGDYAEGFGGFSLKGIVKGIKKVASPVQHALTNVGHAAGAAVTSKIGQGILGVTLAATGVGAPAAALIFGGTKGVGNLIKKGGNLKHFGTGVAQGAVEGVVSVGAGKAVRAIASKIKNRGAGTVKSAAGTAMDIGALRRQGPQITPSNPVSPQDMMDQVTAEGVRAEAIARTQQAQEAAEIARQQAAQQAAEYRAAMQQAQDAGAADRAAQLQAQIEQLNAQAAAATQAAQAAQSANTAAQSDSGVNLQAIVDAARQAAQVAQAAAAAPPTPQATAAVQQAADYATDAATDAAAGATQEASILGGLGSINPVVLIGGVALLAMMTSKPKRGGSRRRRATRSR